MRISDWSSDVCSSDLAWIDALIHFLDHFRNAGAVMATQMAHDLSLPMFAMPHHRSHPALRIFHWFAVGWIVDHIIPAQQLLHARHISRHVAIGRGYDAGGPAHDVIAGEKRFFLGEAKAKMIGRVPWRSHRFQAPSLADR